MSNHPEPTFLTPSTDDGWDGLCLVPGLACRGGGEGVWFRGNGEGYPMIFQAHGLGALFGSALGGYVFDSTGSYQLAIWPALALGVITLAVYLGLEGLDG